MTVYYVAPADTNQITQLITPYSGTLPDGRFVSGVNEAVPDWDIYEEDDQRTLPPDSYRDSSETRTFVGAVRDPAARVRVDSVHAQIPLDALLLAKTSELDQHLAFVRVQSVRSTTNTNFWISLDISQRDRIGASSNFLADRHKDRTLGRDSAAGYNPGTDPAPTTYWPGQLRLMLIRDSNGNRVIAELDEVSWGQVLKDVGLYDRAIGDAWVAVTNAIDAAYSASDWDALAAIDVTAAAYGWPEYYVGAVSIGVRVV